MLKDNLSEDEYYSVFQNDKIVDKDELKKLSQDDVLVIEELNNLSVIKCFCSCCKQFDLNKNDKKLSNCLNFPQAF